MKKILLSVVIFCFVALNTHAQYVKIYRGEKLLNQYPRSYVDSVSFNTGALTTSIASEDDLSVAVAGIYNNFSMDKSYRNRLNFLIGHNTDIEYNGKTGAYADLTQYDMQLSNADVSQSNGKDPWGHLTSAMSRATAVIDGINANSDLSKVKFQYYLGEAYALRAFVTLEMVKIWGDIPLNESSSEFIPTKRDRNEAFELIRRDLKMAIQYLPWSAEAPGVANNNITRMNRAFAYGLLARADLMYAGYALRPDTWVKGGGSSWSVQFNVKDPAKRKELYGEAMNACKAVIDQYGDSKLKTNFVDVFKDLCADKTSFAETEYLWVIPFADGARGQFLNYNAIKSASALNGLKNNESGPTNAAQLIVPTFVYDFEAGDKRKWVTVAPFEWIVDNGDGVSSSLDKKKLAFEDWDGTGKVCYQKKRDIDGFYLGKYRVEWMVRNRNGNDDGIDYPVMRYADVLLMYAEASIVGIEGNVPDGANAGDAQAQFDKIRTRAGLAPVALNMDNLMKERAFELCGEYVRKFDLMRWGKLKEALTTTMERIANLNAHTGEFAETSDYMWFKYKKNDDLLYQGTGARAVHAYEMETIYGLAKGENARPAEFDENAHWVEKNIMANDDGTRHLADYQLYRDADKIDSRHYWPIFLVNVSASDGELWNDYGY